MAGNIPDVTTLAKMWYSETLTGEKTQVAFVESIPQLEEAPDSITAIVLDLNYELAQPGIRKSATIEVPVLYTHTQHKRLRALDKNKDYYWFFELPEATAETEGKALVRYFTGKIRITVGEVAPEDFIRDTITLYKNSDVTENDGMPTA